MKLCARMILVAGLLLASVPAAAQEQMTPTTTGPGYVWWEGEHAVSHNFGPHDQWMTEGGKGRLSNDTWLTANVPEPPPEGLLATWRIQVPEAGDYDLWARVGYRPWAGNQWRFDDGEWQLSGDDHSFHQVVHHVQYRPSSWVVFGRVSLEAGDHAFQVRFPPGERVHQGFDCFVLAARPFIPLGRYRPDEEIPVIASRGSAEGWWPFQPGNRPGQPRIVDMSFLNDPIGAHGFVTMRDGELYFEDGTPVRFWGINASYHGGRMIFPSHRAAEIFADHCARTGVNCVRLHVMHSANSLIDPNYDDTQHIDQDRLDRLDYLAAALRERGIYFNLDLMYHRMFKEGDRIDPELVGSGREGDYNVNWAAGSAALFHPRAIELNRQLYRQFLEHTNPYTGTRWVDEPQMAMLTIQNEQSILWGTTNLHRGRPRQILDQLFTQWLRKQYGTHARLAEAWQVPGQGRALRPAENLDTGLVEMGRVGAGGIDQLRFLYDVETGFYADTIAAMRQWGVRCPIITSNWRGAGETTRLVIQASALGEFVDRHHYSGGRQLLSRIGQGTLGGAFEQVAGRAFGISEWNAGVDGRHVAEVVPLVATMAAFQGWDAMWHFNATSPTYETYLTGLNVTAGHAALYPVAAMVFRRGDIRPGELVYERRRDPEFQFSFEPDGRRVPAEVMAVGRVQNAYVDEPTDDLLRQDLIDRLWDRGAGVVHASTGQFDWHYGDAWMRLNSERTQGAFGALAGRRIECDDVTIETPNQYCAVIVTAMEEEPIAEAGRLLVSVLGRSQSIGLPPGAATPEGSENTLPPCLMEPVTGTLSIRTDLGTVRAVDGAGYLIGPVEASSDGGLLTIRMDGTPQLVYYEITE